MSRTYRRLKGDQSQSHWAAQRHSNPWRYGNNRWNGKSVERDPNWERNLVKELYRYHTDNGWAMNTPSWWVLQEMTVPQRQEVRRLIQKVLRSKNLEDAGEIMFPLAKKPHEYYW